MEPLATLKVDIASLRTQLVELMKDGFKEIPITSLLLIIKETSLIKEEKDENGKNPAQ